MDNNSEVKTEVATESEPELYSPANNKKMKKCKVCGEYVAKSAKACPKCGATLKKRHPVLGALLFIIGTVLIISAILSMGKGATSETGQNAIQALNNERAQSKLTEVDAPQIVVGDFGLKQISGSFQNISGTSIYYAQITFALFDDTGAQIGTAAANINNLAKDAVWRYEATPLTMNDWSSFELSEIAVT